MKLNHNFSWMHGWRRLVAKAGAYQSGEPDQSSAPTRLNLTGLSQRLSGNLHDHASNHGALGHPIAR